MREEQRSDQQEPSRDKLTKPSTHAAASHHIYRVDVGELRVDVLRQHPYMRLLDALVAHVDTSPQGAREDVHALLPRLEGVSMVILEVPVERQTNEAGRENTNERREREDSELPKVMVE